MRTFAIASILATSVLADVQVYSSTFPGTVGAGAQYTNADGNIVNADIQGSVLVYNQVNATAVNMTVGNVFDASLIANETITVVTTRKRQAPGFLIGWAPTSGVAAACTLAAGTTVTNFAVFSDPAGFTGNGVITGLPTDGAGNLAPFTIIISNPEGAAGIAVPAFCGPAALAQTLASGEVNEIVNNFFNGTNGTANGTFPNGAQNGVANGNSNLSNIGNSVTNVNVNIGNVDPEEWVKAHTREAHLDNRNGTHPRKWECEAAFYCKKAGEVHNVCGKQVACTEGNVVQVGKADVVVQAGDNAQVNVINHSPGSNAQNVNGATASQQTTAASQVAGNAAAAQNVAAQNAAPASQVAGQVAAQNAPAKTNVLGQVSGANKAGFAGVAVAMAFVFALL